MHRATRPEPERRTINLLEHLVHLLNIIVVQEPCLAVFFVFFEWDAERVGDVDGLAIVLAKQHANNAFVRVA